MAARSVAVAETTVAGVGTAPDRGWVRGKGVGHASAALNDDGCAG